ncbi:MAG: magnesium transporter [Thermoanaerobaculia bacterium]
MPGSDRSPEVGRADLEEGIPPGRIFGLGRSDPGPDSLGRFSPASLPQPLGDIRRRDFGRVFLREADRGVLLGLMLGVVGFGRALLWGSTMPLAVTVGCSILATCAWANAVGATIPMLATAVKIDPTVMSAPLIATLVDATGLFIYDLRDRQEHPGAVTIGRR